MMNGKIKKAITIALVTVSIIGNTFTPVQARILNNAPVAKVIDCDKLTENMLIHRSNKKRHIMYIERIIGRVTDNKGNGKVLNPPKDGGYYISYASVKGARKGDLIITYCVYNPYSNYDDDVIERWDFIQ
mgnify:CR=1 FL=1